MTAHLFGRSFEDCDDEPATISWKHYNPGNIDPERRQLKVAHVKQIEHGWEINYDGDVDDLEIELTR